MTDAGFQLLVVEDDPVARLVLSRMLTRLGHRVHAAPDVASGLSQAVTVQPDLIFSDFQLPDGTGDDLLAAVREAGMTMPFVLVTGLAELDQSRSTSGSDAAGQPKVAATLTKPVDSRALSACLRTVLDPSRGHAC